MNAAGPLDWQQLTGRLRAAVRRPVAGARLVSETEADRKAGSVAGISTMSLRRYGRGTFLVEALVALVVLSLASAGLLGIVAHALRESGNARWRAEAFDLAASTFARMATEDAAQLDARYATTAGAGYRALLASATRLPGVAADTNAPEVAIDATAGGGHRIAISVRWQLPNENGAHRASVGGVVP